MSHLRASPASVTNNHGFAASIRDDGEPISATTSSPQNSAAGGRTLAGLAAVKATVKSALTAAPIGFDLSASSPDGWRPVGWGGEIRGTEPGPVLGAGGVR